MSASIVHDFSSEQRFTLSIRKKAKLFDEFFVIGLSPSDIKLEERMNPETLYTFTD